MFIAADIVIHSNVYKIRTSTTKEKTYICREVIKYEVIKIPEQRTMAERSNNSITHHNFDNSMEAAVEGCKAKRNHDDCDGAGSSNYEPHPKRIERLTEFMASEYEECAEELGDWQESSESDLEG